MKSQKYENRYQAGQILADYILSKNEKLKIILENYSSQCFCFAIPNGGVPVAEGFCNRLNIYYDIVIVRKIKIPYNTEAGFGSITTDGTTFLNDALLSSLNLSQSQIGNSIKITKSEINERLKFYKKDSELQKKYREIIENKNIFLMDDGLASGFTMLAAIHMMKKYDPTRIYVVVPTAPRHTVMRIEKESDEIFCPNIKNTMWFAVADAYQNWYDIPESEVIEILRTSNFYVDRIN
ncbi:MAG: phosphoribosyltransferase [Promethearchaeota archaeon]